MSDYAKAGAVTMLMVALWFGCISAALWYQEWWAFVPAIPIAIFDFVIARPYMRRIAPGSGI